ncbi:MAG TPA: folylpolyglutamate synthase/dihydrofolate synthase family protein [Gammaproteobacteria bacterium]|nr:folylpolyglutamate synthase/dihydrofolate synthase family protein [Gammaproteobacteria bacterium]
MVTASRRSFTLEDWLAWFETLHPKKIDLSLERITAVLERLELKPPPFKVITVGGTNGKGSCVAMLESIYWHAGYTVGAFTSPHLWRFNERIRLNGADAADAELVEIFEIIDGALGTITLSYFESSTVAALLYFVQHDVEVAVLEVGMGGRLDSANAVDADCALIVSIDLDHREWLGPDREAIGREKAGIVRRGRPAIVADRDPPRSVLEHAAAEGAHVALIGRDFDYRRAGNGWRRRTDPDSAPPLPLPEFGGDEQLGNAAACAAVADALRADLPVSDAQLAAGIRHAQLRGRFELHDVDGVQWVFDVAHNPAAAQILRSSIARLPPRRTLAVFAAMRDKDLAGVLEPFVASVEQWFVTQAAPDRGATGPELRDTLAAAGARTISVSANVPAACAAARSAARPGDRVVVFGSFVTVGAAAEALGLYCAPSPRGAPPATWTRVSKSD